MSFSYRLCFMFVLYIRRGERTGWLQRWGIFSEVTFCTVMFVKAKSQELLFISSCVGSAKAYGSFVVMKLYDRWVKIV